MEKDIEVVSMKVSACALADLDDAARTRVLDWAGRRFDVALPQRPLLPPTQTAPSASREESRASDSLGVADFVDLFDGTAPRTDSERALVGGYWHQVVLGAPDFQSQQVNDALKDVGHGVSNITDALTKLQRRKPALVRQVAKSGRTRQARKRYKITTAGIATVREMAMRGSDE